MGCSCSTKTLKIQKISIPANRLSITPGTFVRLSDCIHISNYQELKKLGAGSFAEVALCLHIPTQTHRALKKIHKAGLSSSQRDKEFMLTEIQILKSLDHPNILKCFEIFEDPSHFYIATEYCPAGDLLTELLKFKKFTEAKASKIIFELLSAIVYCHDKRVIHRDLKPENILLIGKGGNMSIKVADFGSSCIFDPDCQITGVYGTTYYLAPEMLRGSCSEKCDIWSAGIVLYVLLTGLAPYPGPRASDIFKQVRSTPFQLTPENSITITEQAQDLLRKLLEIDHINRISAREAILHPWVTNYRNKNHKETVIALNNLKDFQCKSKLHEAVHIFLASQVVSNHETLEFTKAFQEIDKDGDGKITKQELVEEYSKSMKNEEAELIVDEIIAKLDQDGDGSIDYTEFLISYTKKQRVASKKNLEVTFKMFDLNGDGILTPDEIKNLLDQGQITDIESWKNIIREADSNGDGCIDFGEFLVMMQTIKKVNI